MPDARRQEWRWRWLLGAALVLPALALAAGPQPGASPAGEAAVLPEPPALAMPVQGMAPEDVQDTYTDQRGGGARVHGALDLMAPRGTPVLAVDGGRIAKLFLSKPGGTTVYQFDPTGRFAYYYAHLDGYAQGLAEGQTVQRGQLLGYVGSTGNASPEAPHLHFGIFRLDAQQRWWTGVPLNPYPYLLGQGKSEVGAGTVPGDKPAR